MAVDADKDQLSDLAESSDEEAEEAANLDSDDEQDVSNATTDAADDEASDSEGVQSLARCRAMPKDAPGTTRTLPQQHALAIIA